MRLRIRTTTIAIYFLFTILWVTLFTHGSSFMKENFYFCTKQLEHIEKRKDKNMQQSEMSKYVLNQILAYLDLRDVFSKFNLLCTKFKNFTSELIMLIAPKIATKFHEEMNKLPEYGWIKKLMTKFNIFEIDLFQNQLSPHMKIKHDVLGMGGLSSDGVLNWDTDEARENFPTLKNVKLIKSCHYTVLVLHESDQSNRSVSYFGVILGRVRQSKTMVNNVKSIFVNPFHGEQFICLTYHGCLYCRDETVRKEPAFRKINIPKCIQHAIHKRGVKEMIPMKHNDVFGIYFEDRSVQIWDIKQRNCIPISTLLFEMQNVKQIGYIHDCIVALDDNNQITIYDYYCEYKWAKDLKIENLCEKQNTIKVEEIKVSIYLAARFSNGQVIFWKNSLSSESKSVILREPLNTFCQKGVHKIFATRNYFIAFKKYTENGFFCWNMYNDQQMEIYEEDEEKKNLLKTNWIEDVYERSQGDFIVIFKNKKTLTFYLTD